ncbi:MAG: YdeI/OmpD-associated family protein [Phycisphaerae bacterium]
MDSRHGDATTWLFLKLPKDASARLPSRGQVSVEGTLNGVSFQTALDPDGQGGHWLKVDQELRDAAGGTARALEAGDVVTLDILPATEEPEPTLPPDLRKALAEAPPGRAGKPGAREAWADITPAARRDFIHWITSPKRPETRVKRIATACDMLAKGKRRPCCFDRSGMYDKSLSCPVADDE